jgi:hypothetical protein
MPIRSSGIYESYMLHIFRMAQMAMVRATSAIICLG